MADQEIRYVIIADNKTGEAFKDVGKNAKSTSDELQASFTNAFKNVDKSVKMSKQNIKSTDKEFNNFKKTMVSTGKEAGTNVSNSIGKMWSGFRTFAIGITSQVHPALGKLTGLLLKMPGLFLLIPAAIFGVIRAFKEMFKTISEFDVIDKAAKKVNFTVSTYMALDSILRKSGTSMIELEGPITMLQDKALDAARGGKEATQAFKDLGVQVTNNKGGLKNNEQLFKETILSLSKMKDVALRNALALQLFGNRSRDIIPVLDESSASIEKVINKYSRLSPLLSRTAAASAEFKDSMDSFNSTMTVTKASLFVGTIERLNETLTLLKNSQIGDILFVIGKIVMRVIEQLLDLFNTVLGVITSTVSTVMSGIKNTVWLTARVYLGLIELINKNPIGDKIISDKHVEEVRKNVNELKRIMEEGIASMVASWKQTGSSALSFLTGGITHKKAKGVTPSEDTTPVPPVPTDTSKNRVPEGQTFNISAWLNKTQLYFMKMQGKQNDFNDRWMEIQGEFYKADWARFSEWLNRKDITISEAMTIANEKYQQYSNAIMSSFVNIEGLAWDLHTTKVQQSLDKESEALEEWYNKEKDILDNSRMSRRAYDRAVNDLDKQRDKREKELQEKREAAQREAAKRNLTLQIIMALANGAAASMQMWADSSISTVYEKVGWQIAIAAKTTAAVALIASQMAQLKDGGIIGGNTSTGDKQIVRANSGEMYISKTQQAQLFQMINSGKSGGSRANIENIDMSVNIEGSVTQDKINQIGSIQTKKIEELREMLETMNFRGSLRPIIQNSGAI
jgi:hypothetical protein